MNLVLFPFLDWFPNIKKTWKKDVLAGVLVAIVIVPQALAYSQMAGMPAYYGLYASFIPLILAALFGSSKLLSTGPAVVISILSLSAISKLAPVNSIEFISYSAALAIMVGIIQLLMGIFKLGNIIHFISNSVILGFINALALLIVFSQVVKILDIPSVRGEHVVFSFINFFNQNVGVNYESLFIGLFSLLILVLGKRLNNKIPLALVVIIFATLYSKFFGYSGAVVGEIPAGFPVIKIPHIGFDVIIKLIQPAVVVALVGYMNGISVAKTVATKTKEVIVGNQELIGQGLANLTAGFFGSSAVGGSLSRTSLNYSTGAKTGLASVVTGFLVAIVLLFFTKALVYVPQTVLAAMIIASVLGVVNINEFRRLFKVYKYDGWVAVFSFLATLLLSPNLELGVIIGIIVSVLVYVHRLTYTSIQIFKASDKKIAKENSIVFNYYPANKHILVVSVDRSLIFSNADIVVERISLELSKSSEITYVIFLCRSINFVDATAIETLEFFVKSLKQKGITFVMAGLKPNLWEFIKKLSLYKVIGKQNFFKYANEALEYINKNS